MRKIIEFCTSEKGRRLLAIGFVILSKLVEGGVIPLDFAVPGLGITTGEMFLAMGIGVAATSGSASRK